MGFEDKRDVGGGACIAARGVVESAPLNVLMPSDARARRLRDRILILIALVLSVVLVARAARKDDGVLRRNVEFGARFLDHQDPYEDPVRGHRVHGPYPPSYALVTAPLSLLPERAARVAWALAQIGALVAGWFLVRRWAARAWPSLSPHASVVYASALLLASRFVLRDMAGGGGNLLYVTSAAWGIELWLAPSRRDPRARAPWRSRIGAGILLALPLVLKPNLAPLVLALVCLREWGATLVTLACALALYWLPALVVGFAPYWTWTARWIADVLAFGAVKDLADPYQVPDGFPLADTSMNQSLRESLWRFLDPASAAWMSRALSAALIAVAVMAAVRARGARSRLLAALAFLPVCVLISPISWKAHHAALLPLFAALCLCAFSFRRQWLTALLVVYYGACVLLSEELIGKAAKELLQRFSVVTFGAFALFVATVVLSAVTIEEDAMFEEAERGSTSP